MYNNIIFIADVSCLLKQNYCWRGEPLAFYDIIRILLSNGAQRKALPEQIVSVAVVYRAELKVHRRRSSSGSKSEEITN